jgi:hypothetical protein
MEGNIINPRPLWENAVRPELLPKDAQILIIGTDKDALLPRKISADMPLSNINIVEGSQDVISASAQALILSLTDRSPEFSLTESKDGLSFTDGLRRITFHHGMFPNQLPDTFTSCGEFNLIVASYVLPHIRGSEMDDLIYLTKNILAPEGNAVFSVFPVQDLFFRRQFNRMGLQYREIKLPKLYGTAFIFNKLS